MAVKQNNTEGSGSSADGNQVNGSNGVKSTGTITKSKKMNSSSTNVDIGGSSMSTGVGMGSTGNVELPGCSGNTGALPKLNTTSSGSNLGTNTPIVKNNDISKILQLIEYLEKNQQQNKFAIHQILILSLAKVPINLREENFKRFKEDIAKVGKFFAKTNENIYIYTLNHVWELITMANVEKPSCALAIILQPLSSDMIMEAVQSLLKLDIPDENIRKVVALLCEWLRICTFCPNLNLWIIFILKTLQKQNKTDLVQQIALENIESLFALLVVPVVRRSLAPIVFFMLSIDQTPDIFLKILPRFCRVIKSLKQQSNANDEHTEMIIQQLFDRATQLMARFYCYNNLYEPLVKELALNGFQPSNSFMNYSFGPKTFDSALDSTSSNQNTNAKVGLVNLGNTCYMNSVLQALAMTKEFSREILLSDSKSPLLIKMQQQIALMLYSTRQEITPSKVLNATRPPGFSPGLQQDSSEFLGYLLETLHEQEVAFSKKFSCNDKEVSIETENKAEDIYECGASALYKNEEDNKHVDNGENATTNNQNISIKEAADPSKSTNLPITDKTSKPSSSTLSNTIKTQNCSTIEKTFTGKLATTYKCLTCGWKSCNVDSFRDLQLSFPDVKNDCASNYSVQDLIEYYCSSEKLYGDNQYFCERCKKLSDAERYINFISAPKNLILTLKHFKYDQNYHMRAKLMHKVFHDEKVSLKVCSPESFEEVATVHYDLYAGVVHSGFSMDSGHYYTYAADASNKWYKFNDSIVTPSKTEELHNLTPPNTPYILFYQMGARSNDSPETSASTKVIKVDVPTPLTLEELPRDLRDMVTQDNYTFSEELKMKRYKNSNSQNVNAINIKSQRRDSFDDEDDEQPPPASGCGGNALNINMNRFVY